MKQPTDLHHPRAVRPLVPMVVCCEECERLRAENKDWWQRYATLLAKYDAIDCSGMKTENERLRAENAQLLNDIKAIARGIRAGTKQLRDENAALRQLNDNLQTGLILAYGELCAINAAIGDAGSQGAEVPETIYVNHELLRQVGEFVKTLGTLGGNQ